MNMKIVVVLLVILLSGCASSDARSLLDRIEFDDDEWGCARVQGQIKTSPLPIGGASAQITVVKKKGNPNADSDENSPDC